MTSHNLKEADSPNTKGGLDHATIYSCVVIGCAALLVISALTTRFVIIPGLPDPGIFPIVIGLFNVVAVAAFVTAVINLYQRKLVFVPTLIQGIALCLIIWLIPVAIVGFYLLRKERRNLGDGDALGDGTSDRHSLADSPPESGDD